MDTYIDVKFIFDSVRLGLSSSTDILQKAYVALRVVFLLFLLFFAIISPGSSYKSYPWKELRVRHFYIHKQNNSTSSPALHGNGALTCKNAAVLTTFPRCTKNFSKFGHQ